MRIKVQITLESGDGKSEMIEVTSLERASLRPDTLGLSLAEAQSILAGLSSVPESLRVLFARRNAGLLGLGPHSKGGAQ